ncbi:hypothetical protein GGS21DRAFT_542360 [Xylaria nigripes]|nr:hypothetical protein GGS21DRAFT_542360 [Xylaria nigripes]
MEISHEGATLLGERLGALLNGAIIATATLFMDWATPSLDHLYRATPESRRDPTRHNQEIAHPVYPPPDYEAESYRWGPSELMEEVLFDGCRFPVIKAAFYLILSRRSVWRERTIWIDAPGINQQDIQEKTKRVHLIRDIYHRASHAIAYPRGDWQSRLVGPMIYEFWSIGEILDLNEYGVLHWGLHNHELADSFKIIHIAHAFVNASLDLCRKHAESPEESIRERLWSAIVAGRVDRQRADMRYRKAFQHWLVNLGPILGLMATARDRAYYRQLLSDGGLSNSVTFTNDGTKTLYQHSFLEAYFGRRFAISVSGRLCIVLPLTKNGDAVILPFWAQPPFLVRQYRDSHDINSHDLVGKVRAEGVMYEEMIGCADEEFIRIL